MRKPIGINPYDCLEEKNKDCDQEHKANLNKKGTIRRRYCRQRKFRFIFWDYVRIVFALLFVIVFLFALLKFINRKNRMFNQHELMKNIGGLSLGQNKSIQLVVIGETYFIVGVGDEVRLLKEITDAEEINVLENYFKNNDEQSPSNIVDKIMTMLKESKREINR